MRFHTHDRTPKTKMAKSAKAMLAVGFGLIFALFVFVAMVCSLCTNSIAPAVLILTPVFVLAILFTIVQKDMAKAFVEINNDTITVVDYYFGIKKEKSFLIHDIANAEILIGYSMRVRGYRYSNGGCSYIVIRDNNGKYLFKIICVPETKQFFEKYFNRY